MDSIPKNPCIGGTEALAVEKEKLFSAAKAKVGKIRDLAGCWPCLLNLLQFWSVDLFPPPFVGEVRTSLDQFEVEFHGGISAFAQGDEDAAHLQN